MFGNKNKLTKDDIIKFGNKLTEALKGGTVKIKAKWGRTESVGNGWCEHDEFVRDNVTIVGFIFNNKDNSTKAICLYDKNFKEIPLYQLTVEESSDVVDHECEKVHIGMGFMECKICGRDMS